ncbi:hypothetical protein QTG54_008041 [Skeletonema marinoi]|uniref:Uncharacterized protein n=1 Tax=Skeletonema marinoi TaxID=267567 RepID=A0AAD8Y8F0_9STRA|nr:hypothetical protein QTG54_008041 [Skeletonema marinoi]
MQQEFEAYISTLVGGDGESEAAARTKRQQLPKAVEDNKPKQQLQSIQKTETEEVPSEVDTTNYDATEKCLHGLPAQKVLANKELYKVFVDKFREEYSAKAAVAGNTLEECFLPQANSMATFALNPSIWK